MESEQIRADFDEPTSSPHKLFRGIMLSFLFALLVFGFIAAFSQMTPEGGIPVDRSKKVEEVKEVLKIEGEIILPTDGLRYDFKLIGESFREIFTFDREQKEKLNVQLADERAREMAVLSARGDMIPPKVIENYNKRINQASNLISLRTDANAEIQTRTVVRDELQKHLDQVLNKVETEPSNTNLGKIISDFRTDIKQVIMNIDKNEIEIVKNTVQVVRQKQANIKLAEMVGDVEQVKKEIRELEEIDQKLNRLHIAKLCTSPIKTLSITSFEDVKSRCPAAALMEDEIRSEFER